MNLFTNEEKNDRMKKEEYLTADKSNSSTPTGISRFLYETPEKQQNTVSHNFSYNPQKPQSIKTISADRTANSLNKNTFKQPVNSFNNVKPPKSIKAEDITEDLEKERIFKATKRIAKNLPEDKLNEVYKLKEKRPDDYYNLTDNSREDYKRMKDLFSPRVQFSVSNYENNYDMMNKDEKIMLTSNAQKYFNKLGYTDKNGNYLEEDGIWGPKTQKVFERYKKDTGYVSPKNNNVDKAYTLAKDLKEDIYNPETLIASPENLRSDVSLYGKSPVDMDKKYLPTRIAKDKYNNIANENLSESTNKLYSFAKQHEKSIENMDDKTYRNLLDECANDNNMSNDTFQYGVMKVLRSINHISSDASELYKFKSVINYLGAVLKESLYYSHFNNIKNSLNDAIEITTDKNLIANSNAVKKAWMNVYLNSCEIPNPNLGNNSDNPRNVNAENMDYGINYIINACKSGIYDGRVYKPGTFNKYEVIYNDATKKYNNNVFDEANLPIEI